jgi:hypothetical protein
LAKKLKTQKAVKSRTNCKSYPPKKLTAKCLKFSKIKTKNGTKKRTRIQSTIDEVISF